MEMTPVQSWETLSAIFAIASAVCFVMPAFRLLRFADTIPESIGNWPDRKPLIKETRKARVLVIIGLGLLALSIVSHLVGVFS